MEGVILKPLLGLVLGEDLTNNLTVYSDTEILISYPSEVKVINLDTLGRLCKEWCRCEQQEAIATYFDVYGIGETSRRFVAVRMNDNTMAFTGRTELEAIIKATEWVAKKKELI